MHNFILQITNPITWRTCLRLAWGCAILVSTAGNAQKISAGTISPVTFAQFHQTSTNIASNVFAYIDHGPSGDSELVSDPSGVVGGALPVVFNYLSVGGSLPSDLSGNQAATLSLTSSTLSSVVTGFGGFVGDQQILGNGTLVDSLSITRSTPAGEGNGLKTNLLTMTFTGQLLGAIGGAPQLSGDTTLGYTVTFTSDFLTFTGTSRQFSLTYSAWTNGLQLSTQAGEHLNGGVQYFQAATANGAGTFAGNVVAVPEPSTLALGTLGLTALVVGSFQKLRDRRRKT